MSITRIQIDTHEREQLLDVTEQVRAAVASAGITQGLVNVFVQSSTAGVVLLEGRDAAVQADLLALLQRTAPRGMWTHDGPNHNGDAHLKAALTSPSESAPVIDGAVALGVKQGFFLCEFDGPREGREVVISVLGS